MRFLSVAFPFLRCLFQAGYFHSVFSRDDGSSRFVRSSAQALPYLEVTYAGVHNLLLKNDTTKSAEPDGTPDMFLKRYSEWNAHYLTVILHKSLDTSNVPKAWKIASVVPVFKSGGKQLIANYRPVSHISTCCKLLEHIIHKPIVPYLTCHNILSQKQHGFRSGFSTVAQPIQFTHDIVSALNCHDKR